MYIRLVKVSTPTVPGLQTCCTLVVACSTAEHVGAACLKLRQNLLLRASVVRGASFERRGDVVTANEAQIGHHTLCVRIHLG